MLQRKRDGIVLGVALGAAALFLGAPAGAVTFTPISGDSFVQGTIVGTVGPFDQTDASTALEPVLDVTEFRAGGNIFVQTQISATNSTGTSPPSISLSVGQSARTSGSSNDAAIDYVYSLTFSLDGWTRARLINANAGGGFPEATALETVDSAALTYELRGAGGGPTAFLYSAPSSNSAGTYAEAVVPAGTYEFVVTGSASAIGDACCTLHTATAGGITRLDFEDAPALPLLSPPAAAALAAALASVGGAGSLALRRRCRTARRPVPGRATPASTREPPE